MTSEDHGRPRLDKRAILIAAAVAVLLAMTIWFIKSRAVVTRSAPVQPLVPRSAAATK